MSALQKRYWNPIATSVKLNISLQIFRYAKELVEAEMPCSIRLLGVRVSQFRGDHTPDPAQRTLDSLWTGAAQQQQQQQQQQKSNADTDQDLLTNASSDIEGDDDADGDASINTWDWYEGGSNSVPAPAAPSTTSISSTKTSTTATTTTTAITAPSKRPLEDEVVSSTEAEETSAAVPADAVDRKHKRLLTLPSPVPTTATSIVNDKRIQCPVCSQHISALSTLQFEMHVDKCLKNAARTQAVRPPPHAAAIRRKRK